MDKDNKLFKSDVEDLVEIYLSGRDTKRNPNKKKICDVSLHGSFYSAYEYDLKETSVIEKLAKSGHSESDITFLMLKIAIPDALDDVLLSLTQSQSIELLNQIQATTILNRVKSISSTIH